MYVVSFAVLSLWILVLSIILYKTRKHYFDLISSTNKNKLDQILETLISKDERFTQELEEVRNQLKRFENNAKSHIQKIGLVRFDPFKTWGTDQSFVLAIMDGNDDGIVLNYIYTKEGLRVYSKKIKKGKGQEYELSVEEKKAIEKSNLSI